MVYMDTNNTERRFVDKRELLSLENEALGLLDIDMDEVAERPFVDPKALDAN